MKRNLPISLESTAQSSFHFKEDLACSRLSVSEDDRKSERATRQLRVGSGSERDLARRRIPRCFPIVAWNRLRKVNLNYFVRFCCGDKILFPLCDLLGEIELA